MLQHAALRSQVFHQRMRIRGGGEGGKGGGEEGDGGCNNGSLVLADREIVICPCVTLYAVQFYIFQFLEYF